MSSESNIAMYAPGGLIDNPMRRGLKFRSGIGQGIFASYEFEPFSHSLVLRRADQRTPETNTVRVLGDLMITYYLELLLK